MAERKNSDSAERPKAYQSLPELVKKIFGERARLISARPENGWDFTVVYGMGENEESENPDREEITAHYCKKCRAFYDGPALMNPEGERYCLVCGDSG